MTISLLVSRIYLLHLIGEPPQACLVSCLHVHPCSEMCVPEGEILPSRHRSELAVPLNSRTMLNICTANIAQLVTQSQESLRTVGFLDNEEVSASLLIRQTSVEVFLQRPQA